MDTFFTAICPMPPSENDSERYKKIAAIRDALLLYKTELATQRYELTLWFYGRWDEPDGTPRKRDVPNYDKLLIDAIRDVVGLDDRWFRPIHLYPVNHDGEEYVEIQLVPA